MAITAEIIKTIVADLLKTKEDAIIQHISTECAKINMNIKELAHCITSLEQKVESNEKNISEQSTKSSSMENTLKTLQDKIQEIEAQLEDQTNRNMRDTLVIKGLKEKQNEKHWDDTTQNLVTHLSSLFN